VSPPIACGAPNCISSFVAGAVAEKIVGALSAEGQGSPLVTRLATKWST